MRVIEIFEVTFLTGPLFVAVLLNFCFIIDYIIKIVTKPGIDKYKGAISAFLYGKAGIQIYAESIKVVIALSKITEKLPWR